MFLMIAIASQVYGDPDSTKRVQARPEQKAEVPNYTTRVSASQKGSTVTFIIDLADDFNGISEGPTLHIERLLAADVEGTDFKIPLGTHAQTPKQITFVLPRVTLKGLFLILSIYRTENQGLLPPRRGIETRRIDLESLIHGSLATKNNVEQPGAGEPAAKPADKTPAEVQPSTPTSKVAPR